MAKLTKQKAAQMLHDKTAHGKPLTDKQRKYFGAVANGKKGIKVDPMGYWNPENQGKPVIIPSDQITMQGVDFPVLGVADNGKQMVMYPYQNYNFQGAKYVTEYPLAQDGKQLPWYMKRQQGDIQLPQSVVNAPVYQKIDNKKAEAARRKTTIGQDTRNAQQKKKDEEAYQRRLKYEQEVEGKDFITPTSLQERNRAQSERIIHNLVDVPTTVMGAGELAYGVGKFAAKQLPKVGEYLITQTPLRNAYKINPFVIKENPEMFLYRARPIGQDVNMNMAAQLRAKQAAGEPLTWYQKNLLNPQTNPQLLAREKYYGQWFEKDPSRLDFYIQPGTRNFADDDVIEILRTRLPKKEAAKFNVSQFNDAKVLSASPETEFILPKDMITSAERFPESSWQQLMQEHKKFNTPHWLRGYKEVPKPKSSQQITREFIDWADTPGFMERNPQFNPRKYENWVKSKTDFSAPFDPNMTIEEFFTGGKIDNMQQAKSGIHIKESKKGTFTAAAKKHGKGVQEFARQVLANKENYSPAMVKKAVFASNSKKWKHEEGGAIYSKPSIGGGQFLPIQDSEHYAQYIPIAEDGHFIREGNSNYFLKDIYSGLEEMRTGGQLRWNQAQEGLNIYNPQSEYMWNVNPDIMFFPTSKQMQAHEADLAMDNKIDASTLDMRPKLRTDLGKMAMQSFSAPNILDKAPEAKRPVPNLEKQPGWTTGEKIITGLSVLNRFIPERDPIKSNAPKMEDTLYAPWNTPSYGRGSQAIAKHGLQIHGDYNMDDITRMEQGGELNVHWGGEVEPISYNPVDGQETVLFNGASHDNGGIGIDFQGNPVEVQGGEPAMKDSQGNLNILGGMQVPGQKYTFQTMGKKIAKQENKYTKQLDKGSEFVNKADLNNRFDILSMNTGKAMMAGATQKLKELSEKKQDIIALQNSILDTAKEMNLDPNALSKGKIKKGKDQKTAQWGDILYGNIPLAAKPGSNQVSDATYNYLKTLYDKAKAFEGKGKNQAVLQFQKEYHRLVPDFARQVLQSEPVTNYGKQTGVSNKELKSNEDQLFGKRTVRYMQELEKYKPKPYSSTITPAQPKKQDLKDLHQDYKDKQLEYTPSTYPLGSAAQDLAFYQVAPELAAFATNRVRPVPTFGIQQDLYQPYKISMQDQRNANTATFRAMQEQLGYNPTAMSTLAAQKYQADQQSLADEFRTNQGIETDIINKNLGIVNETRNKNLQLQADQWMKQEMARANTRKEDLGILSSISNKIGQNKREQTQIKLWENMFKYRPNSNWQMQWQGGDADLFAGITPLVTEKKTKVTEKDGDKTTQTTTTEKANGGIAKAVKRMGKYNSLG